MADSSSGCLSSSRIGLVYSGHLANGFVLLPLCFVCYFASLHRTVALKRIKGRMRFSDSSQGAVLYPRSSLSGSGGEETWWGIRPSQCSGGRLVIETGFFSRFLQVRKLPLPVILSPQPVFWVASEGGFRIISKFNPSRRIIEAMVYYSLLSSCGFRA